MSADDTIIEAHGLSLDGRRGRVYGPVGLRVPAGALVGVAGASGSGRTSLLLTLAGRMRPTGGTARVCGIDLGRRPGAVRALVGLGPIPGVSDLDGTLTAAEHLRAELALLRRPRHDRAVQALLDRARSASAADTRVGDLKALERKLLAVALGLAGEPRVLVADDVERDLTAAELQAFLGALRGLTDGGVTVLASCTDARALADADAVVRLSEADREVA